MTKRSERFLVSLRGVCLLWALATSAAAWAGQVEPGEVEIPDPTLKPRPAEMMPLAERSLLLGVARSDGYYYLVGMRGHILRSRDGQAWEQRPSPVRSKLNRIRFTSDRTGWIVGNDGVLLQSQDAGVSWQLRNFDAEQHPLYDVHFFTPDTGLAVGGKGQVLRTEDGGQNWELLENEFTDLGFHYFNFAPLADGSLLLVGEKGLIQHITDAGETWEMLKSPYVGSWFGALPHGRGGAVLYGLRGHVFVTEDVASAEREDIETYDEFEVETTDDPAELTRMGWRKVESGVEQGLLGGDLLPDGEVVLTGVNGVAIRSHAGVRHFSPVHKTAEFSLNDLLVVGRSALAVGMYGPAWLSITETPR